MKKVRLTILLFVLLSVLGFSACIDSDDDTNASTFSGVTVTVTGDVIDGYKLYTDFGAILVPTSSSLSRLPWLTKVSRAIVSFDLTSEYPSGTKLEADKTYHIELSDPSGWNVEVPTYIVCVDTLSEDYQIHGKDSIELKNRSIHSFEKATGTFYVKNGYLNVTPTFSYDPRKLVYFSLYYDGVKDIDVTNGKMTLNLYFNNDVDVPYGQTQSLLSFKLSDNLYADFINGGMEEQDSIEVSLKASTLSGKEELHCKMAIKDFMTP